jgi:hypothetical protein
MPPPHMWDPMGNSCDQASAKEESCRFSLKGGVVVAALLWHALVMEALE